jgi:hypothetical protein
VKSESVKLQEPRRGEQSRSNQESVGVKPRETNERRVRGSCDEQQGRRENEASPWESEQPTVRAHVRRYPRQRDNNNRWKG